jgi:protoporphyrinogen oxidase
MKTPRRRRISRREFLQVSGTAGLSVLFSACGAQAVQPAASQGGVSLLQTVESVQPEEQLEVVIIGAGIAGLSAAFFLRDYNLRVLEKEAWVGGRTISGTYQGIPYAQGTEVLRQPSGALLKILTELALQPVEIPSPMDAHFYNQQFYYGEDGVALMMIQNSSLADFNRLMAVVQEYTSVYTDVPDFELKSDLAELDNISAREWLDRLHLPAIYLDAYNVTSRGKFGANLKEISALSFVPEIGFDFEGAQPISSVKDLSNSPEKTDEKTGTYTFPTGITEVTDALAKTLQEQIVLESEVTSVLPQKNTYLVNFTDSSGNRHVLEARTVILAVPAPIALQIAPLVLTTEQQRLMRQIPYASYITAALFSEEPIFNDAFDLAVPDGLSITDLYDATWVRRVSDANSEKENAFILGLHLPSQSYSDQTLLQLSDELVLERIFADLEKILPDALSRAVGYNLHRFPYAYPVMTPGAYRRLTRLHRITKGALLLAGDYMIYPTFEAAAQSGYLAAQEALGRLK